MAEIALRALRNEAAALRSHLAHERQDALKAEAKNREEALRVLNLKMDVNRRPANELLAIRQECDEHTRQLLRITEELQESEIERSLESKNELLCKLTQGVMREAVIAADGFTYDKCRYTTFGWR